MVYQGTRILGESFATAEQMVAALRRRNPLADPGIANLYLQWERQLGIRGDLAFAQALVETNFLSRHGCDPVSYHNYAGLGSSPPDMVGHRFVSPEQGVLGHLQTLFYMSEKRNLPAGMSVAHPAVERTVRNVVKQTGDWNRYWSNGGPGYGETVDRVLHEILLEPRSSEPYRITRQYLPPVLPSRPGSCTPEGCWQGIQGIVVHRTGIPTLDAVKYVQALERSDTPPVTSTHFAVDSQIVLQLIPLGEVALHTPGRDLAYIGIAICEDSWASIEWWGAYQRLVWLSAYLLSACRLDLSTLSGRFWWSSGHYTGDPAGLGLARDHNRAVGLFDWNRFVGDVQLELLARDGLRGSMATLRDNPRTGDSGVFTISGACRSTTEHELPLGRVDQNRRPKSQRKNMTHAEYMARVRQREEEQKRRK